MSTSVHPYKGYLNTQFRIFVTGENTVQFEVFAVEHEDGHAILEGTAEPNEPYNITLPYAGEFIAKFDNGTSHKFRVEDGYRYGGNKFKTAYIFDDCPWAFVIMHDRTYFYNYKTRQSFVEPISPDEIEEISTKYVLFKNEKHKELTLFSLELQQPILWINNLAFRTKNAIGWIDQGKDGSKVLIIYSLEKQRIVRRITCDKYLIDKSINALYYHSSGEIHKVDCSTTFEDTKIYQYNAWQQFITFINLHYAVSYAHAQNKLYLFDLLNGEERGEINVIGNLARINDVSLINITDKIHDFRVFDFSSFPIKEAIIKAVYSEIEIYPCPREWETSENCWGKFIALYSEKVTTLKVSQGIYQNEFTQHSETHIKSIGGNFLQEINLLNGNASYTEKYFIYYNASESLVIPRFYPRHISYDKEHRVLVADSCIIKKLDNEIRILNRDGFWDVSLEGKFDASYFVDFKILKSESDGNYYHLNGTKLGKSMSYSVYPTKHIEIGGYIIFPGGKYVEYDRCPQCVSPLRRLSLSVDDSGVSISSIRDYRVTTTSQILQDIFDTQHFSNVLLDENGQQFIYRDNQQIKMIDLANGTTTEFENLSYINHINGIRPFVRISETSQAILINPIDGQPIDVALLQEYQFISPDKKLFADKILDKYIEYYDKIKKRLISKEEFNQYLEKFCKNWLGKGDSIVQNRLAFINEHYDFLRSQLIVRYPTYKSKTREEIIHVLCDTESSNDWFIGLFIDLRGVAVIKRISNNEEVARIPLGRPLWFLNYVSFSKDSRYVAIAGRYPNGSSYGGLFLVYDLVEQQTIIDNKSSYAVWTTAFADDDMVAAYTSTPNSFVGSITNPPEIVLEDEKFLKDEMFNVRGVNFLTFSPDGKYFACSHQGYLCYKQPDGTKRVCWGHQPSSLVSIRTVSNPKKEILAFYDLSEEGIADTNSKQSVASVSFSNDNSRIMMVGRNGVVVVRNINL